MVVADGEVDEVAAGDVTGDVGVEGDLAQALTARLTTITTAAIMYHRRFIFPPLLWPKYLEKLTARFANYLRNE